jgi:hypothetical protein
MITTHNLQSSTSNDIVKVYNTYTQSWSQRKYGEYTNDTNIKCGIVINDIMYTAPLTGTGLLKERKDFSLTDFCTPDISVTIDAIDTVNKTITITSPVTILAGAFITQGSVTRYVNTVNTTLNFTLNGVSGLATGDATITHGIVSTIEYQPVHFGAPDYEKNFEKLILFFDNDETAISNLQIVTASDLDSTEITTEITATATGWGAFPWGTRAWGGLKITTDKIIIFPPLEHTRCAALYMKIIHSLPQEQIALCGYSVIGENVDTRIRR